MGRKFLVIVFILNCCEFCLLECLRGIVELRMGLELENYLEVIGLCCPY